jgi:hypothetical protein
LHGTRPPNGGEITLDVNRGAKLTVCLKYWRREFLNLRPLAILHLKGIGGTCEVPEALVAWGASEQVPTTDCDCCAKEIIGRPVRGDQMSGPAEGGGQNGKAKRQHWVQYEVNNLGVKAGSERAVSYG